MNLFSWIKSGRKQKNQLDSLCRQKQRKTVLSSERLEPRHYLSASGLGQAEGESWHVTYDTLKEAYQHQGYAAPHIIGSGYSSSNLNQADVAMLADVVRARYDVTGKGKKIGVISTSFNALGGMDKDIALGVLPDMKGTDSRGYSYICNDVDYENDEGRAMAQLVHAIAPDAELYFATPNPVDKDDHPTSPSMAIDQANEWAESYVNVIKKLVDEIKVDIIVDDLYNPVVPWFQDGIIAQAVDGAVEGKDGNKAVAYFSAAGNDTNTSYQSTFRGTPYPEISSQLPSSVPGNTEQYLYHDFDPDAENIDIMQEVYFPGAFNKNNFFVQWDQPWQDNNSANEVWFFTEENGERVYFGKAIGDPDYPMALYPLSGMQQGETQVLEALPNTFYVAFVHKTNGYEGGGGQELPTFFKWIAVFDGSQPPVGENFPQTSFIEYAEHGSSTVWGHNNSKLAANVGAAQYWSTPAYQANSSDWESVLSDFSSFGGTPIFFGSNGHRQEPEYRPQPLFIAPQNGDTSFFAPVTIDTGYPFPQYLEDEKGGNDPDKDYLQNFSGTSAATPNVGAVAALLLELNGKLTPAEIYEHLAASALPLPIDTEDRPAIHPPTLPPVGDPEHFNYPTGVGLIRAKEAAARVADISIQGKVFEDFSRNGIQDQGDRPLEGIPVFLDSNGNGVRESEQALTKPNVQPLTIHSAAQYFTPENITYENALIWPAKAGSVITFKNIAGTITDVELSYTIHAPEGGDPSGQDRVFLTLISPLGIRVPITGTKLQGNSFNSSGNFSIQSPTTVFGSEQTILMGASPAEPHNQSLADLAAFKHTPANGSWSLEVMNADPDHSYTLDNWSLTLMTEEPQVETDAQGTYEFSGSYLSFSSAVGAYTPTVELTDNQFITTNNKTSIGKRNLKPTVNIGISLPRVERPELLPSTKIIVDNSVPGPNPFVFSWNNLATSLLPSVSGVRFVVDSVRGTVEKKSGDTWVDVSTPPTTSNPRELLRLLSLRVIKPDDELRWIPPAESPQAEEAFSLVGWNGELASKSKSSIRFELV